MDVPLADIQYPTYPTGSYNFVRRLRNDPIPDFPLTQPPNNQQQHQAPSQTTTSVPTSPPTPPLDSRVRLNIAIIGAGVAGLSNAIALKQDGHNVTVYEQACQLSEVGAGIQIPPNSSRILHSWGLAELLERRSVRPSGLVWRRWEDGRPIAHSRLGDKVLEKYGSPYYVTHRAHLHDALHERTQQLDVPVELSQRVQSYDLENSTVTFVDGKTITADLIIAADGLRSIARKTMNGDADTGPIGHGLAAYRATVPMNLIMNDPRTRWVAEKPCLNLWVGADRHVMSYAIAGNERYNLVMTHPTSQRDISKMSSEEAIAELRAHYAGWDPSLVRILDFVTEAVEWPIFRIDIPPTWTSPSRRTILTGDAAHAMVPYMALGAATAVEDAAALAAAVRHMQSKEDLAMAIDAWLAVRQPRTRMAHEASDGHGIMLHFADGPVQEARDKVLAGELGDFDAITESPNQWSDPCVTTWAYHYDAIHAIDEYFAKNNLDKQNAKVQ